MGAGHGSARVASPEPPGSELEHPPLATSGGSTWGATFPFFLGSSGSPPSSAALFLYRAYITSLLVTIFATSAKKKRKRKNPKGSEVSKDKK